MTCGPTWVAIDDTRVLSNISTGALGQMIASQLKAKGAKVTVLQGPTHQFKSASIQIYHFTFFDELKNLLNRVLKKNYDVIIHAAAVSDYRLKTPFKKKISSSLKNLNLHLVPTEKLIEIIRRKNPKAFLVGFKLNAPLTKKTAIKKTKAMFKRVGCNLIVANSLTRNKYSGFIISPKKGIVGSCNSRKKMAEALVNTLNQQNL